MKGGPTTNNVFAESLGILPDNAVKLFIAVEGPNDIAFLRAFPRPCEVEVWMSPISKQWT